VSANGESLAIDLARRAQEAPDRTGMIFEDGRSWTYAEMAAQAGEVAAAMIARGVAPEDRVAIFLPNGPELVFTLFGTWYAGAVPVTISSLYNADELAKSLSEVEPALIVTSADRVDTVAAEHRTAAIDADGRLEGERHDPVPEPPLVDSEADGAILFTGGTTGSPKAVRLSHGANRGALARLAKASKSGKPGPYPLAPAEVTPNLIVLPLFHSGGQHTLLFALHVGRSFVLARRFAVDVVERLVNEYAIDNMFLMPTMVFDLVEAPPQVKLASVRSVLVAGQALDPQVKGRFESRYEIPILESYGSTEIGHVAGWTSLDLREGRWKPGAAGRLYEGVEVEIRDHDGATQPRGEVGEICVRSALTKGYVSAGDGAAVLVDDDGWVHSGDIGYIDEDDVLFLAGRARDMIKTGGFQVWPAELEGALHAHEYVADVAVVGLPEPRLGEIPVAVVVPTAAAREAGEQEVTDALVAHLRNSLAHFKAAREVAFVDALPRTAAGKIDRAAVGRVAGEVARTAPSAL
jgi:long-chain acyl-CoA synthetase